MCTAVRSMYWTSWPSSCFFLFRTTFRKPAPRLSWSIFSRRYGQDEVRDTYTELLELRKGGLLYSEDDYQPYADALTASPLKAMCLHVSHDCNLRCRYCFAGQGIYGGKPQTMPFEVAKAAIDFLVAQSGPRRHLELDFFGGEPLLNLGVVKQTVAYARGLEKSMTRYFALQ